MKRWNSVTISHTGKVRQINEDSYLNRHNDGFWAVADGMGGHSAGDYASQQIVMSLSKIDFSQQSIASTINHIDDSLVSLDEQLKQYAKKQGVSAVGSTVAALYLSENSVGVLYWVGDSRIYLCRDNVLTCISNDHSLVQELVDAGELTVAQAEYFPSKNIITRAIGANNQVCSEISLINYQKGDVFLICSDGLNGELSHQEMESIACADDLSLNEKSEKFISETLTKKAADNVTLALIEIIE